MILGGPKPSAHDLSATGKPTLRSATWVPKPKTFKTANPRSFNPMAERVKPRDNSRLSCCSCLSLRSFKLRAVRAQQSRLSICGDRANIALQASTQNIRLISHTTSYYSMTTNNIHKSWDWLLFLRFLDASPNVLPQARAWKLRLTKMAGQVHFKF